MKIISKLPTLSIDVTLSSDKKCVNVKNGKSLTRLPASPESVVGTTWPDDIILRKSATGVSVILTYDNGETVRVGFYLKGIVYVVHEEHTEAARQAFRSSLAAVGDGYMLNNIEARSLYLGIFWLYPEIRAPKAGSLLWAKTPRLLAVETDKSIGDVISHELSRIRTSLYFKNNGEVWYLSVREDKAFDLTNEFDALPEGESKPYVFPHSRRGLWIAPVQNNLIEACLDNIKQSEYIRESAIAPKRLKLGTEHRLAQYHYRGQSYGRTMLSRVAFERISADYPGGVGYGCIMSGESFELVYLETDAHAIYVRSTDIAKESHMLFTSTVKEVNGGQEMTTTINHMPTPASALPTTPVPTDILNMPTVQEVPVVEPAPIPEVPELPAIEVPFNVRPNFNVEIPDRKQIEAMLSNKHPILTVDLDAYPTVTQLSHDSLYLIDLGHPYSNVLWRKYSVSNTFGQPARLTSFNNFSIIKIGCVSYCTDMHINVSATSPVSEITRDDFIGIVDELIAKGISAKELASIIISKMD